MKKTIFVSLFLTSYFLLLASVIADSGVVIDTKGKVTVTESGKAKSAKAGTQFNDGAEISVAAGGSAAIMLSNGATRKINGGEKFTASKIVKGPNNKPLIKGLAMAYNDATSAKKGPTVHGMVKAVPTQKTASNAEQQLSPEREQQMKADLGQINSMGLSDDGEALMSAQVYYKYGQNKKMVNILLPLYKSQNPPSEMVKKLLALGYEKMGNGAEAARYR